VKNQSPEGKHALLISKLVSGSALFLFVTASFAERSSPNFEEAHRLLNEGKSAQSAALLQQDIQNFAGNAEFDALLGLALYQSGQLGEAFFAFERVLMSQPENVEARLKAAQISLERGNVRYASELLQALLGQQLSHAQQQEKIKIEAAINNDSSARSFSLRGYLSSGIGSDNNVTSGPAQTALIIPALSNQPRPPPPQRPLAPVPYQLGTATQDQDQFGMLEAGLSMQKTVGNHTWISGEGNIHQTYNSVRADVNSGYSNLNLGVLTRNGHEFFGAALLGQSYQVANVNYRNSLGARANWTHVFNEQTSLTSYLQQLAFIYPNNAIYNTTRRILGVTVQSNASDEIALQCGIYAGNEVAQDSSRPSASFQLKGASVGGNIVFNRDLSLAIAANYESHRHDAADTLYYFTRIDSLWTAGTSLDYKLNKSWHLIPVYSYTRNSSNTELYDYKRNIYMLQLKWDFDNE
jgi:Tfp pilus assembly protein PilF